MPVYERVMSPGEWSLTLDAPRAVRAQITTPYGHVVILPARLNPTVYSDAVLLAAARYVGVCLRPGPQQTISGAGAGWWLGAADGHGANLITTATTLTAATFESCISTLRPSSLVAGSVESAGGSYANTFHRVTRRAAIDAVCSHFGREWRVRPDFALDAGTATHLYGATPAAVAVRRGGGRDIAFTGFRSRIDYSADYADYASQVLAIGRGGSGSSGGASTFRDGQSNITTITRVVDAPDTSPGNESSVAATLVGVYGDASGRRELSIAAADYVFSGGQGRPAGTNALQVGARIYVHDPDLGLLDAANPIRFDGELIHPVSTRIYGSRWPIHSGLGVYYRYYSGTTAVWVDLSPYVVWETGDTQLEVGAADVRAPGSTSSTISPAARPVEAAAWDTYTPSWTASVNPAIGDGTIVGAWRRVGTTVHIRGQITMGASTTYGTGNWNIGLPSGLTAVTGQEQLFDATALDAGVTRAQCMAVLGSGATTFNVHTGGANLANPTQPHTWGSGDSLSWSGTIEVQP